MQVSVHIDRVQFYIIIDSKNKTSSYRMTVGLLSCRGSIQKSTSSPVLRENERKLSSCSLFNGHVRITLCLQTQKCW